MEQDAQWLVMGRFADWAAEGEYQPAFIEVRDSHTSEACDALGTTLLELSKSHPEACRLALDVVFEELMGTPCEPDGEKPLDVFLAGDGRREPPALKKVLRAVRDGERSLYEVVEVERGLALIVEDRIRPDVRHRVLGPEESKRFVIGDLFAARLIRQGRYLYFTSTFMKFDAESAAAMPAMVDQIVADMSRAERKLAKKQHRPALSEDEIRTVLLPELGPRITNAWLVAQVVAEDSDTGDAVADLRLFTLTFKIAKGYRESVESRLDKYPGFQRARDRRPLWKWLEEEDPDSAESTLEIVDDMLVWETISTDRAASGRKKLMKLLGPAVGAPLVAEQSWDEALQSLSRIGRMQARSAGLSDEDWKRETARSMDALYRAFLDDPNALLDGMSPRQAVKTEQGRRNTARFLRFMEKHAPVLPGIDCDLKWMWEELGILDLRR